MPIRRLLRQALIHGSRAHYGQLCRVRHRELAFREAVIQRADHPDHVIVRGKSLDILRTLRRVVDPLADIILDDGLQPDTCVPMVGRPADQASLADGELDRILDRKAAGGVVAAERQVGAEPDRYNDLGRPNYAYDSP